MEYFLNDFPSKKITTKQKKKKKWFAETFYILGEGETETESLLNLAHKLRLHALDIECLVKKSNK